MSALDELRVEVVAIDAVKPDPHNARAHPDRNLDAIEGSLRRFGQRRPLVVTRSGVIVAGNGTWLVARDRLSWTEIAVTRFPSDDLDEVKAYALADNRSAELAEWDAKALDEQLVDLTEIGWDVQALGFDRPGAATSSDEVTEDDPGPVRADPVSVPGDVWVLGEHRLLCGDATSVDDLARVLAGDDVDLVFTDPPYGVDYVGKTTEALTIAADDVDDDGLYALLVAAFRAFRVAMCPGSSFYVFSPPGPLQSVFRRALADARLDLHQQLMWVKNVHVLGRSDYHYRHEPLLYGWRDGARHTWEGGRRQNTVWEFPRPARSAEHPTMKPVALVAKAVLNSSRQGAVVLDAFAGAGSTLMAAEQTARRARVIELDPRYVDVIARRWQAFTGRAPVLEATGEEHDFAPAEAAS